MTTPRPPRPQPTKIGFRIGDQAEGVFDPGEIDLAGAFAIKNASGLTLNGVMRGIEDGDPLAIQVMIWFVRREAGERDLQMESVNFKFRDLDMWPIAAVPPVEAPSPSETSTGPASEISTSDSSLTSVTSPPTTSTG